MIAHCQHCPQEMEAADDLVGSVALCPGCGQETVLQPIQFEDEPPVPRWPAARQVGKRLVVVVGLLAVVGLFAGGILLLLSSTADSEGAAFVLAAIAIGVGLALVVAWSVLPVVMWFYLSKIDRRLAETNARLESLQGARQPVAAVAMQGPGANGAGGLHRSRGVETPAVTG